MDRTTTGWLTFIVALGMMCGLLSSDIAKLTQWGEIFRPSFVAVFMAHFAAVITAFIGGKMIPENRDGRMTRSTDSKIISGVMDKLKDSDILKINK